MQQRTKQMEVMTNIMEARKTLSLLINAEAGPETLLKVLPSRLSETRTALVEHDDRFLQRRELINLAALIALTVEALDRLDGPSPTADIAADRLAEVLKSKQKKESPQPPTASEANR